LPARAVDASIVADVSHRWPEVCIFLFGEELDQEQLKHQFPGVTFVEPPLATEDESAAKSGWGECMDAAHIPYERIESGEAFLG
jgi:hypothetical protein